MKMTSAGRSAQSSRSFSPQFAELFQSSGLLGPCFHWKTVSFQLLEAFLLLGDVEREISRGFGDLCGL